jgi:hypothetical protein
VLADSCLSVMEGGEMRRSSFIKGLTIATVFFLTAFSAKALEDALGVSCAVSVCGPDDLPFVAGIITALLVTVLLIND